MSTQTDSIILDTNVVSYIFNNKPQARYFSSYLIGKSLTVSFITVAEVYHGAYKDKWGTRRIANLQSFLRQFVVLPFDYGMCLKWAEIKTSCEVQGHPIEDSDCWIAACAMYYDCLLLTNNMRHFQHVNGLKLIPPGFN